MELMRQYVRENSDAAFAALVSRHVNMVYSAALRKTGNPAAAEEITQAVFVILAKKANRLLRHTALSGWLYQAARLTAANFLRTEIRRARLEQEACMQSLSAQTEPEIWPQIGPLLEDAMGQLGEKDRNTLALRFFEGKSFQEIGAAFGVSENAARKRTNYALEKLRNYFSKRGVASTAETIAGAISAHSIQAAPASLAKAATVLALAKGAAASTSTLTLIKGALKIMAWTKAKTAIAAGVVVLLAAGTTPILIKEIQRHTDARPSPVPRTTAVTASIKGQFFGRGQLVDAGNVTPEAAWESRYWARAMGDYDAVIAAAVPQAVATAKDWMGDKATFGARSRKEFATSFEGFQILARKDLAGDKVELKYQFTFANWQQSSPPQQTKIVTMIKVNGAWICSQTRAHDASWDVGSQPEPES